ncbi:MAG: selenide, water dikinase SelD, partial [Planctomycetota bacterium]
MALACDIWSAAKSGGCAAKLSPLVLRELRGAIQPKGHADLLVGLEKPDDAAVWRLTPEIALVQTLDFITPICQDPYLYGQIAAANSLSDVWAMGGKPLTAMNICCFPARGVDSETLGQILKGGLSKIEEAGAFLVGGHTVRDDELKYGLSVTGVVHPERYTPKGGARPGDRLILTKPVGSGVYVSGAKRGRVSAERLRPVLETLAVLNRTAGETMMEFDVRGATDITGFGLGGHALEMAEASRAGLRFFMERVPVFPDSLVLLEAGITTSVTAQNLALVEGRIRFEADVSAPERGLFADPQTSGGLLIAVEGDRAEKLVETLRSRGVRDAAVVG